MFDGFPATGPLRAGRREPLRYPIDPAVSVADDEATGDVAALYDAVRPVRPGRSL
jgi:hypothetical protein